MADTTNGTSGPASAREDIVAAILLAVAALVLRAVGAGNESAWLDEVYSLTPLDKPSFGAWFLGMRATDPPALLAPGYFAIAHGWARVMGSSLSAMRGLSMLFSAGTAAVLYFTGRQAGGRWCGIVAGGCFALSLPHVYYGQEIRMYALATLLTALAMLGTVCAMRDGRRMGFLALVAAANAAALWTSVFTVLLWPVQGVVLANRVRDHHRAMALFLLWHAAHVVAYELWYRLNAAGSAFWMGVPGPRELLNAGVVFAGGRFSNESAAQWLPGGVSLEPLLLAAFAATVAWTAWLALRGDERVRATFALGWLLFPPCALWVVAIVWKPCFIYRYVMYASLGLFLCAGIAVASVPGKASRFVAGGLLFLLLAYPHAVRTGSPFRPDYRAAAKIIRSSTPDEPVLVHKQGLNGLPLAWADPGLEPRMVFSHGTGDLHDRAAELAGSPGGFWALFWRWDRLEAFEKELGKAGAPFQRHRLGGMPPLILYHVHAGLPP